MMINRLISNRKNIEKGIATFLLLVLSLLSAPSYGNDCLEAHATWATKRDTQDKFTDPRKRHEGTSIAKNCKANFAASGFGSVIDQVWGGDARMGRAIACHENGGLATSNIAKLIAYNEKHPEKKLGLAYCGFQIHELAGWATLGKQIGVCTSETGAACAQKFTTTINSDPVQCARAGYQLLKNFQTRYGGNIEKAICNYAGGDFVKQYAACQTCGALLEFKACADIMDGIPIPTEVETNIDSSNYGTVQENIDGTKITLFNCQDKSMELARGIAKAMKSYQYAAVSASDEMFKTVLDAQAKSTATKLRGDLDNKYCIKVISKFFNLIQSLLSGIDAIITMVKSLIQSLLEQVCSAVASSINSLLSSICLPLPDLSFGLSLGTTTKSCSGLSLASLLSVSSGSPDLSKLISGSKSDTLSAVDGLYTSGGIGVDLPGWFQRKLNSSKSETLFQY